MSKNEIEQTKIYKTKGSTREVCLSLDISTDAKGLYFCIKSLEDGGYKVDFKTLKRHMKEDEKTIKILLNELKEHKLLKEMGES